MMPWMSFSSLRAFPLASLPSCWSLLQGTPLTYERDVASNHIGTYKQNARRPDKTKGQAQSTALSYQLTIYKLITQPINLPGTLRLLALFSSHSGTMETVNKIFESTSTALWPPSQPQNEHQDIEQHGEEPLSGVQGQGTATDPYDAGNRDSMPPLFYI